MINEHSTDSLRYIYKDGTWLVEEIITKIDAELFEGRLENVSNKFNQELNLYREMYLDKPIELKKHYCLKSPIYPSRPLKKQEVQFDFLELKWEEDYWSDPYSDTKEKYLTVWGYRKATPKEIETLESDRLYRIQEQEKKDQAELERLQKKLGKK